MTVSITIDDAAERLKTSNRVMVIGCSGGGKSTLAKQISARFGMPYVSMDQEFSDCRAGSGATRRRNAV